MKYIYALLLVAALWGCNKPPQFEPDPTLTLAVYPNPGKNRIWIYVKNDTLSEFSLQILGPDGKIVFEWYVPEGNPMNGFDIDPTQSGTGAYHAVLHKNGSVYTKKFMAL
ncbi:T9SS type A sorting domain-containing protein [Dyadobacter sp. CY261]|uniref:T9SS type A sorting domain-containing protein n=1 Tax=Dyadobacter sp. CY261 TaxID=2907203 RepID=UPI001F1DDD1E|nr:T9SS type A sorting domain-containing protein [Dyadobacter sp. CY261]MCF0074443.1 T9SS type A sorting domain-containing protein [Dyadobacter sp. CY261]